VQENDQQKSAFYSKIIFFAIVNTPFFTKKEINMSQIESALFFTTSFDVKSLSLMPSCSSSLNLGQALPASS